jgi:hypothetical protein
MVELADSSSSPAGASASATAPALSTLAGAAAFFCSFTCRGGGGGGEWAPVGAGSGARRPAGGGAGLPAARTARCGCARRWTCQRAATAQPPAPAGRSTGHSTGRGPRQTPAHLRWPQRLRGRGQREDVCGRPLHVQRHVVVLAVGQRPEGGACLGRLQELYQRQRLGGRQHQARHGAAAAVRGRASGRRVLPWPCVCRDQPGPELAAAAGSRQQAAVQLCKQAAHRSYHPPEQPQQQHQQPQQQPAAPAQQPQQPQAPQAPTCCTCPAAPPRWWPRAGS